MIEKLHFAANLEPAKLEPNFGLFSQDIAEAAGRLGRRVADRGGRVCLRRAGRTGERLPGFRGENLPRENRDSIRGFFYRLGLQLRQFLLGVKGLVRIGIHF